MGWPINGFGQVPQASSSVEHCSWANLWHCNNLARKDCGEFSLRDCRGTPEFVQREVVTISGGRSMTRSEERQRERASAIEYLGRLKIGLIETLQAEGDGPVIDSARKTMARLVRRIAVLDALLKRDQVRGKAS